MTPITVSTPLILNRLRQALLESQARNPRVSIRSFAKHLGLPAGTVSLVLLGKRRLSKKTALKFARALQFDPVELAQLDQQYRPTSKKTKNARSSLNPEQLRLSADQFHVLRDWHYYAILNLICIPNQSHEPQALAERLGLTESKVEEALIRMHRLKLINKSGSKWIRTYQQIKTTEDVLSQSLQHSHLQNLELAQNALKTVAVAERDFSSMTLPISVKRLPEIKAKIRAVYQQIVEDQAKDPEVDEVYQIQTQIFPLTKNKKGPKT
jgi:uncharacterized protein (TIGR02147 family)